jgi:rhodanese-related sulfurtransferase
MDGEISPDELAAALDSDNPPTVVDIREPRAFEAEHIPDSVNVPFSQLTARIEQVADADHVVTVCPHGKASVKAARLITSFEGFEGRVESLETGLTGWDGPLEDNTGREESQEPDAPF